MSVPLLLDPAVLSPPRQNAMPSEWKLYVDELEETATWVNQKSIRLRTAYTDLVRVVYEGMGGHVAANDAIRDKTQEHGSGLEGKYKDLFNALQIIDRHCDQYQLEREAEVDGGVELEEVECSGNSCLNGANCPMGHDSVWALALLAEERKGVPVEETYLAAVQQQVGVHLINMKYTVMFRRGGQAAESRVSGTIRLVDSVRKALESIEPYVIWLDAQSDQDRALAVEIAVSLYGSGNGGVFQSPALLPSSSFGVKFTASARASRATTVDSLARELLKSMAATLRGDHAQGKKHPLREKANPSQQRACGKWGESFLGWRRRCGGGLWLMWWQSSDTIVFGLVSANHDDMELPVL